MMQFHKQLNLILRLHNMNQYKPSFYNHFIEVDSRTHLLFNARSLATVELHNEEIEQVRRALSCEASETDSELTKQLLKAGFMIASDVNEKQSISDLLWKTRSEKKFMSLTIVPTMGCNFNCPYCFESEEARDDYHIMSEEVQDQLIASITDKVKQYGIKEIDVCWFGGEPLLAISAIERLSRMIIALCEDNDIHYSAKIITNGYRLKAETAKLLKELNVNNAQVTIDGPKKIHDERRVLKGRLGSFQRIIRNIIPASRFLNVVIRVNVDRQNINYLHEMLDEILDEAPLDYRPQIILAPVHIDPNANINYQAGISDKDFANAEQHFIAYGAENKQNFAVKPSLISNACAADHLYSYMVGPRGELYHCWEDFGDESLQVGTLSEGRIRNLDYIDQYYRFDPTQDPKCKDCTVMPLCMGGCPKRRMQNNNIPQCGKYKYNLKEHVLRSHNKYPVSTLTPQDNDIELQTKNLTILLENNPIFHTPEPNNYVLMLIRKSKNKTEYINHLSEMTEPLNKINFNLLRLCLELNDGKVCQDIQSWAKEIKNKTNLRSVPYIIKVIDKLAVEKFQGDFLSGLSREQMTSVEKCIQIPNDLLNLVRVNVYCKQDEMNTALANLLAHCEQYSVLAEFIERIEVAKVGLASPNSTVIFPKIILYFTNEFFAARSDVINHCFSILERCFSNLSAVETGTEFSLAISSNMTVTHGYRLYKTILHTLGIIDRIYSKQSNHALSRHAGDNWQSIGLDEAGLDQYNRSLEQVTA